jgi:RNA polymerase sigma-70 factor, ECF subfamily
MSKGEKLSRSSSQRTNKIQTKTLLIYFVMTTDTFTRQLLDLQDRLLGFALSLTHNRDEAQDVLQETMVRAISSRDKFAENTNFKAWVFTIMRNIFINDYRRVAREQSIITRTDDLYQLDRPAEPGFSSPEGVMSVNEIHKVLGRLNKEMKQPFMLYLLGYKYNEIAEKMQIPLGTVKSRIFLARKFLMEELKDFRYAE